MSSTAPQPSNAPSAERPPPRPRRARRVVGVLAALALIGFGGGEGFLRWRYGLGDVPRVINDPKMEYRFAPDGHYRRLGHRIDVNAYSMRCEDFPAEKRSPDEIRVMVIGDSVVNGGAHNDQSQIATSLIEARLRADFHQPAAIVGNISAGSWGPQNELAYVQRFGLFQADLGVVVVSSHDATDEIGPLTPGEGLRTPVYHLAWREAIDRYFGIGGDADAVPGAPGHSAPCLAAFDVLLTRIEHDTRRKPIVMFHYEKPELDAPTEPAGMTMFRGICTAHGIVPLTDREAQRAAGEPTYLDVIHPNAAGHRAIASVLLPSIEAGLRLSTSTMPATSEATP